jgi:O-phosphoseryl-tRNA(Cys) synthetase
MYIYVKNNINGDIKELFERIERVREEDLKVKFRELLFPFLFPFFYIT